MDSMNFRLLSHKGTIKLVTGNYFSVKEAGLAEGTLFIELPEAEVEGEENKIKIGVYSGDKLIEKTSTNFLGPTSYY